MSNTQKPNYNYNVLTDPKFLFFIGYRFDSGCTLKIFPPELINLIIDYFPSIEFDNFTNSEGILCQCKFAPSSKLFKQYNRVVSGPGVGGWASTKKLSNYNGPITFKFKQKGKDIRSFWSAIGLSSKTNVWEGPGFDFNHNFKCEFYYRMDQGTIHCEALKKDKEIPKGFFDEDILRDPITYDLIGERRDYPCIHNLNSSYTIITLMFKPGEVRLIKCNKFDISEIAVDKNIWYPIPKEFFLAVDIYYPDTYCTIYCDLGEKLYTRCHENYQKYSTTQKIVPINSCD